MDSDPKQNVKLVTEGPESSKSQCVGVSSIEHVGRTAKVLIIMVTQVTS